MKILFLDIDGVLIPAKQYTEQFMYCGLYPDPATIKALNKIIGETGAKIVISSTLRLGQTIKSLQNLMQEWNINGDVIGMTPYLFKDAKRGHEIEKWMEVFEQEKEKVDRIVILDDKNDMEQYSNYLVKTEFNEGLTEAHADKAIRMLNL